jgi:ApbE superfamily uncharacterized protein (UPF0280 family)
MAKAKILAKARSHSGVAMLDQASLIHYTVGMAAGMANIEPSLAVVGAIAAMAVRDVVEAQHPGPLTARRSGESYINQISDVLITMIGVYSGKTMRTVWVHRKALMAQWTTAPAPNATAGYYPTWVRR